jgi:hypothetical protein
MKRGCADAVEARVQKTRTYLDSEIGRKNRIINIGRGYNDCQNLFAAVQAATRLIKYERIVEVLIIVQKRWAPARGRAA